MNKKEENNVERLACGKLLYPEQITVRWPIFHWTVIEREKLS